MAWWVTYTSVSPHEGGTLDAQAVESAKKPTKPPSPLEVFGQPPTGPYPDKAAAEKVATAYNKSHLDTIPTPSIPNPLSALGQIAAAIRAFFDAITDAAMWRSIGWIFLGMWMIWVGIMLWLRVPQKMGQAALAVGGAAAKAAI